MVSELWLNSSSQEERCQASSLSKDSHQTHPQLSSEPLEERTGGIPGGPQIRASSAEVQRFAFPLPSPEEGQEGARVGWGHSSEKGRPGKTLLRR